MNKDGLKKIYLIKSAGYEFADIDISDNTLLLGESGVGKTTLMRAVLFFYTMDYSDSVLNLTSETKKSFNDWYFKEHNSQIIYEYTKGQNRYLFVVSKTSKLHYTFIDITSQDIGVRELFIDANKPVNFEKLNENIQKNSLPSCTTTIKERYINIFHKKDEFGKKVKTDAPVDFSLFEDVKSRKEFARTLSNIFASSSIKSTNIKKTIVSLIDNSTAKVALFDIKMNLDRFAKEKKEIEKFEKKIPTIEELASEYGRYQENKKEFKTLANKVEYIQKHSVFKLQEINSKLHDKIKEKDEQTQKYNLKREMLEDEKTDKKTDIAITSSNLEKLIKKEEQFKTKNISYLLEEQNKEQNYKDEKEMLIKRYEALTSNVKDIELKYEYILSNLQKAYNANKYNLEKELSKELDKENENINTLIQNKERQIQKETSGYVYEKVELEKKDKELNKEFAQLNKKQGQMQHFPFNKEKIANYEESIKTYEKKLLEVQSSIIHNDIDIKEVEKEIQNIKESLSLAIKTLNENYEKTKNQLLDKKSTIEKKLDFDSQNLYGYLNKNDVKNKEKIVTYLKDEILFTQKNFSVKEGVDDNSVFGLTIEFEEEFSHEYEQEKLLKELDLVKTEIKELNKYTQKSKHKLEDEASLQTKEKNRQRSVLYKTKDELITTQKSYIKNKSEAEINLSEAKKEANRLREDALKELNNSFISLEEQRKNISYRLEVLTKEIESKTASINKYVSDEIKKSKDNITTLKVTYTQKIDALKEKLKEDEKRYNDEKLEVLKENGVDKKVLQDIKQQEKNISLKLSDIEKNRQYVYSFLEIKPELEKIPYYKKELEQLESQLKDISKKIEHLTIEYKNADKKMLDSIKELESKKENIESFLNRYNNTIQDQDIQKTINNVAILNFSMEIQKVDVEDINTLINLFKDIKANEAQIKALVISSLKDLKPDNLFKIDIPMDFIEDIEYTKTAKELVEYIQKDKLTPLKDALSEQFKGEIRKITKELDIFNDALLDIYAQIKSLGNVMAKAVKSFNVIDSIEIRQEETNNNILNTLKSLSEFYDNHSDSFLNGLFDITMQDNKKVKKELDEKIMELVELLNTSKEYLELEDGFVLEFRIVEKGNNLKWRQNIDDIGSNGTSTLVKSIINISMLQMVSKNIVKDRFLVSHCVLDEIGTISTDYFKELKEFVNRSGFVFLNGMPIEDDMLISMYPTIYVGQNRNNYSKMILASKMEI
ncbi:MAG: ATP-binding protein [Campylobacterales bacterium]